MTTANNKFVVQFVVTLISILLLIFIIVKADWSYFSKINITFQPVTVLLTAFSVAALFFLRTVTIYLFLPKSVSTPFQEMLLPSSKYQLLSLITPMHAADLLLPFMLKTVTNTGIGHHFAMVYIFRLTDVLVLFAIFILSSNFILELSGFDYEFILYAALAFTLLVYIYPFFAIELSLNILNKLFARFNRKPEIFNKIRKQIIAFQDNISLFDLTLIIISVILTWLVFALIYFQIFNMYGFQISFFEALFCVAMVNIASLIPVQTFGGIGLRESTLLLGLLMLGYSVEFGAVYAVTVRLTALFFQLTVFFAIFLLLSTTYRSNKQNL